MEQDDCRNDQSNDDCRSDQSNDDWESCQFFSPVTLRLNSSKNAVVQGDQSNKCLQIIITAPKKHSVRFLYFLGNKEVKCSWVIRKASTGDKKVPCKDKQKYFGTVGFYYLQHSALGITTEQQFFLYEGHKYTEVRVIRDYTYAKESGDGVARSPKKRKGAPKLRKNTGTPRTPVGSKRQRSMANPEGRIGNQGQKSSSSGAGAERAVDVLATDSDTTAIDGTNISGNNAASNVAYNILDTDCPPLNESRILGSQSLENHFNAILRKTKGFDFCGRQWLFETLDEKSMPYSGGPEHEWLVLLQAPAGFGKTEVMAKLARPEEKRSKFERKISEKVIAYHFCKSSQPTTQDGIAFVKGLAYSLWNYSTFSRNYKPNEPYTMSDMCVALISALHAIPAPNVQKVILIDGLLIDRDGRYTTRMSL